MTKNEKKLILRHCGVPCCGTCKWFERQYSDTKCESPHNRSYYGDDDDEYTLRVYPNEDNVCDYYEVRDDNDELIRKNLEFWNER